jgi:hypothetical protein
LRVTTTTSYSAANLAPLYIGFAALPVEKPPPCMKTRTAFAFSPDSVLVQTFRVRQFSSNESPFCPSVDRMMEVGELWSLVKLPKERGRAAQSLFLNEFMAVVCGAEYAYALW